MVIHHLHLHVVDHQYHDQQPSHLDLHEMASTTSAICLNQTGRSQTCPGSAPQHSSPDLLLQLQCIVQQYPPLITFTMAHPGPNITGFDRSKLFNMIDSIPRLCLGKVVQNGQLQATITNVSSVPGFDVRQDGEHLQGDDVGHHQDPCLQHDQDLQGQPMNYQQFATGT